MYTKLHVVLLIGYAVPFVLMHITFVLLIAYAVPFCTHFHQICSFKSICCTVYKTIHFLQLCLLKASSVTYAPRKMSGLASAN